MPFFTAEPYSPEVFANWTKDGDVVGKGLIDANDGDRDA